MKINKPYALQQLMRSNMASPYNDIAIRYICKKLHNFVNMES